MTETLSVKMGKIRRKMTRFEGLVQVHCGHEEGIQKAINARVELEGYIEGCLRDEYERGWSDGQERLLGTSVVYEVGGAN